MSIYITIIDAQLSEAPKNRVSVKILSKDTELKTNSASPSKNPVFKSSFIGSIRQQFLTFQLVQGNGSLGPFNTIGTGKLYLHNYIGSSQNQINETLTLNNQDKLNLEIYYTEKKNFLGPIEFYQLSGYGDESTAYIQPRDLQTSAARDVGCCGQESGQKKSRNFFVCCDNVENDDIYTRTDYGDNILPPENPKQPKLVEFYKGPTKNKNLFSCCDQEIDDHKFTIVEDYYRDR